MKIHKSISTDLSNISFKDNQKVFILNLLKNHIKTSFFLISEILAVENALSSIRPKVVLTSCEYCKMGRAAVAVGNKANMQTVALQHGIITPFHWGYMFNKSEKTSFVDAADSRPLPWHTLLCGMGYLELLLDKSSYPPGSLIVTGQPRYDHLYKVARSMDKGQFLKERSLRLPLIVWTSQGDAPPLESNRNINCFLHLLDSIPELSLFIKPHPNEKNLSIYEPLTRRSSVTLSKDVDLYKLLNVCSIMITKNSTTAMEAAALDKPVIVLNLGGESDVVDYVTEGMALGVYKEDDLPSAVETLLKDDSVLRSGRSEYIKKYLYKIDGRSSERVADFLEKLLV